MTSIQTILNSAKNLISNLKLKSNPDNHSRPAGAAFADEHVNVSVLFPLVSEPSFHWQSGNYPNITLQEMRLSTGRWASEKRSQLKNYNKKCLQVITSDSCQGEEYTIVLLDFSISKGVGFLRHDDRVLVSFSRAMDGMTVLCSFTTLRQSDDAKKFFDKSIFNILKSMARWGLCVDITFDSNRAPVVDKWFIEDTESSPETEYLKNEVKWN